MRNHECNQRMYLFSGWLIASFLMLCAVGAIIAGCALPVGDDYRIKRNTSNPFVIGTYDLQVYVPVPVAGSEPVTVLHRGDLDVQVTWKDAADNDLTGSLDSFQVGEVYRADITINTKKGWLFDPARNFQYPEGSVSIQPGPNADTLVRSLATVTYLATEAPKMVDQVDLSLYIPVPVLEATPVGSFWAEQYTGTVKWSGGPETEPLDLFQGGVIYTAELSLAAAPGYVFGTSLGFYHTGDNLSPDPAALAFTAAPDSSGGTLSIVFPKTRAGTDIALPIDLTEHISAPVAEATARTSFISPSMQFSGSVIWKDRSGAPMSGDVFRGEEIYIAEVALTAAPGFVFPGNITGDDFHHQYDDSYIPPVYTPGNGETGTVTLTFPMTPDLIGVNDYDLQNYLPLPEAGVMPVWELDRGGVMGTVSWDYYVPSHGYTAMSQLEVFRCDTVYRAEITMRVKAGYIFNSGHTFDYAAGLHWGPAGNSNGKKIRSFTVVYEEPIGSFASEPTPGSALKRIRAAKARGEFTSVAMPLYIDLSAGEEEVWLTDGSLTNGQAPGGAVLDASNSPGFIRINGRGRKLRLTGTGTGDAVITVKNGVTLYLRNITLAGIGNNTAPLIAVDGGTLILENGVVVENNTNSADSSGGGIVVSNNGTLRLTGATAVIRNNVANTTASYVGSGGVFLSGGTMLMEAGTISGNTSPGYGGGVYNKGGSLTMTGGTISGNSGGVALYPGSFTMTGGEISGNIAPFNGGGVYSRGTFTMKGGKITGNTAGSGSGGGSGGGVYNRLAEFTMEGGEISGNTAIGANAYSGRGGGVFFDTGTFIKKGGIIATNSGHVVYLQNNAKQRYTNAGESVNLYAHRNGDYDPWFHVDPSSGGVGDTTANWE